MITTLQELKDFENRCLVLNKKKISEMGRQFETEYGNILTEAQKKQIKEVYTSNGLNWWNESKMTKNKYIFNLCKIDNKIIGISGVDEDDLEIRDDAVHKDYQNKGIYKELMKYTNRWLKINKPNKIYYLFTEKTNNEDIDKNKKMNHINSGLVLLDRTTSGSNNYKSNVNGKTYYGLNSEHFIFRTPGHHKINFVTYKARGGYSSNCSGIYIGNGIILTADHCDREHQSDWLEPKLQINYLNFPFKSGNTQISINSSEFIRYEGRTFGGENFTNDFAIIKLSENDRKKFNEDMEIIPLLQDNLTIHGEVVNEGGRYPSKSSENSYYTYGYNDTRIRISKITNFDNPGIARDHNVIVPPLKSITDSSYTNTLNNFRTKLNCVKIEQYNQLAQGDSGGPHYHIKEETGQIVYIGPTGTQNYSYCSSVNDTVISAVYQHKVFLKSHSSELFIYNLKDDKFDIE